MTDPRPRHFWIGRVARQSETCDRNRVLCGRHQAELLADAREKGGTLLGVEGGRLVVRLPAPGPSVYWAPPLTSECSP